MIEKQKHRHDELSKKIEKLSPTPKKEEKPSLFEKIRTQGGVFVKTETPSK